MNFLPSKKRINSIEDKYLDGDLTKEEYNRMLERYTKEASTIQQQVEMRENPNRSNIEPKTKLLYQSDKQYR